MSKGPRPTTKREKLGEGLGMRLENRHVLEELWQGKIGARIAYVVVNIVLKHTQNGTFVYLLIRTCMLHNELHSSAFEHCYTHNASHYPPPLLAHL